MKSLAVFRLLLFAGIWVRGVAGEEGTSGGWAVATPGYQIALPKDENPHYDYRTEWWYFTGNLRSAEGKDYGYELTFFRYGYRPPAERGKTVSRFVLNDLKFAHFALTDIDGNQFHYGNRTSRGAYGEAGFADGDKLAWIDGWELRSSGSSYHLKAANDQYAIDIDLRPEKPVLLEGDGGYSQKAEGTGHASYYYSITRLRTSGTIRVGAQTWRAEGTSWYDREWATNQLTANQAGWNWFAIQLSDGSDLMIYQMRLKQGGIDPQSNGKWLGREGNPIDLKVDDFQLKATRTWKSPKSKATYPVSWELAIPKLDLELGITAAIDNQELNVGVTYWEGAVRIRGIRNGKKVEGVGYMELTGFTGEVPGLSSAQK